MSNTVIIVLGTVAVALIICITAVRLGKLRKSNRRDTLYPTPNDYPQTPQTPPTPQTPQTPQRQDIKEVEPIDLSDVVINKEAPEIYNLVILDRSGSMVILRSSARLGYNQTLNTIREAQKTYPDQQQHFVSFVTFNEDVNTIFENIGITEAKNLSHKDYNPRGGTAMYDAIGMSLNRLKKKLDAKEKTMAVVTIISDGAENSSREYNQERVVALIEEIKDMGCTVNFMGPSYKVNGSESYAEHMAKELHIDNFLVFEYTEEGFNEAWQRQGQSSRALYNRFNEYEEATQNMAAEERRAYYRQKAQENRFYDEQ